MVKTIGQLYRDARNALLEQEDPHTASLYARNLLCQVTGKTPEKVIADGSEPATEEAVQAMWQAVNRLLVGEPLAYVLGQWDFYGMTLQVDRNVLIPRDDTCSVTELAVRQALFLPEAPRILDLCTGSGCIGLALAHQIKDARVTLADISQDALAVAKKNIALTRKTGRVSCYQADALKEPEAFLGQFHMIVSNPPYITTQEMQQLPVSVRDYEPHLALHGGEDGLIFYRAIAANFRKALKPDGYLCFEFGMGQGDAVCQILLENGYTILERARDFNDRERAVIAQYHRKEE